MIKEYLKEINLNYNPDQDNYLINNLKNGQLEKKFNKVISGDKKIIICSKLLYIFNENSADMKDFYSMIEETSNLVE